RPDRSRDTDCTDWSLDVQTEKSYRLANTFVETGRAEKSALSLWYTVCNSKSCLTYTGLSTIINMQN
ncbi:MAG: hypothetical protein KAT85_07945, partial [candidate division Zixibacteria bacterium]|nr:hypothetical protein [candidate division Zixibacteria bacterium]